MAEAITQLVEVVTPAGKGIRHLALTSDTEHPDIDSATVLCHHAYWAPYVWVLDRADWLNRPRRSCARCERIATDRGLR
jgi:hypothetical protein